MSDNYIMSLDNSLPSHFNQYNGPLGSGPSPQFQGPGQGAGATNGGSSLQPQFPLGQPSGGQMGRPLSGNGPQLAHQPSSGNIHMGSQENTNANTPLSGAAPLSAPNSATSAQPQAQSASQPSQVSGQVSGQGSVSGQGQVSGQGSVSGQGLGPSQAQSQGSSMNGNQSQDQPQTLGSLGTPPHSNGYILKITNLPKDLTTREATVIFSLVIDDIAKIELNNYELETSPTIFAFFKTFNTCITTFKLLNQKCIFGNDVPIQVELDESLTFEFNSLSINPSAPQPPSSHSNSIPNSAGALGSNRSRFSFNDPFQEFDPNHPQPQSASGPVHPPSAVSGGSQPSSASAAPPSAWNGTAPGSGQSQPQSSSQPQTPLNNLNFDWNQSNPASLASKNSSNRRTSSAFFQSNFSNNLLNNSFLNSNLNHLNQPLINQLPQSRPVQPQGPGQNQAATPGSNSAPNSATSQGPGQSEPSQDQAQPQHSPQESSAPTIASQIQDPPAQQDSQASGNSGSDSNVTSPVQQVSGSFRKDVPDLSLLARVPPPANPADQNPPCNTLYVGNLPPDATEQELRALFSPQKGFRRLSFRTKTNSSNPGSNNHGPMCFVEFEDVAHATRALAELYGRILPRSSSSNGKGGIRLSFSKNPLGVRGPQRRSSSNQVNGNYNYNYHMKPN